MNTFDKDRSSIFFRRPAKLHGWQSTRSRLTDSGLLLAGKPASIHENRHDPEVRLF